MSGSGKRQAKVLGPLECAIANKLIRSSAGLVDTDTTQKKWGEMLHHPTTRARTWHSNCPVSYYMGEKVRINY